MSNDIGWRFPLTDGGRIDGYNDPGIAHFSGSPLSSLARETIQNSLDAQMAPDQPVHVSFELVDVSSADIGMDELGLAFKACKTELEGNPTAKDEISNAQVILNADRIPCLRISDRNTTGLRSENWRALVKMQGFSYKPDVEGAGGSYGIGKYAPFAVSALRTVFYWTCYQKNGKDIEFLQGKTVLMSHKSSEGETQGTGFYGAKKNCSELSGTEIPQPFRVLSPEKVPVPGTSVAIVGFSQTTGWRLGIAASVIENFFYAIAKSKLTVIVEPDERSELLQIDNNSLNDWFELLEKNQDVDDDRNEERAKSLAEARVFYEISKTDAIAEKQDSDLGHCRLWIRTGEGLPSKVAIVRRTGMLVTTEQTNLIRFPGYRDFAALCVFEDPKGNELLRRMENPKHDKFEPDRLPESDKNRGRRALKRITDWIRSEVKKHAGAPDSSKKTVLSELATYLPHLQPDEPFGETGSEEKKNKEPGFGERVKLTLKPVRHPKTSILEYEDGTRDGDDTYLAGKKKSGSGQVRESGESHEGAKGSKGDGKQRRLVPISGVRILSIEGRQNCYQVSFRSDGDGVVRLELAEAGDSSAIPRGDVRALSDDISLENVRLSAGIRTVVDITADAPIGDRAWRLSAVAAEGESDEV